MNHKIIKATIDIANDSVSEQHQSYIKDILYDDIAGCILRELLNDAELAQIIRTPVEFNNVIYTTSVAIVNVEKYKLLEQIINECDFMVVVNGENIRLKSLL